MEAAKNAVLAVPTSYPSAIMGLVVVLVLVIIYLVYGSKMNFASGKKKKPVKEKEKPKDDQEETVDELIDEIKEKQK